MDVVIQKAENPCQQPTQVKKKRKVTGVSCTVYKPFEVTSLNLPSTLSPLFEELDSKSGFLRIFHFCKSKYCPKSFSQDCRGSSRKGSK